MLSDRPPPQEADDEEPPPLDADEARERLRDLVSALLAWEEADVRTAIGSGARWPLLPSAIDAHPRRRSMSTVARWQLVSGGGLCRIIDAHATEKQRLAGRPCCGSRSAPAPPPAPPPPPRPPPGVTSVSLRSLATGALNAASLYELALHASLVPAAWRWMLRRLPDAASLGRRRRARALPGRRPRRRRRDDATDGDAWAELIGKPGDGKRPLPLSGRRRAEVVAVLRLLASLPGETLAAVKGGRRGCCGRRWCSPAAAGGSAITHRH